MVRFVGFVEIGYESVYFLPDDIGLCSHLGHFSSGTFDKRPAIGGHQLQPTNTAVECSLEETQRSYFIDVVLIQGDIAVAYGFRNRTTRIVQESHEILVALQHKAYGQALR